MTRLPTIEGRSQAGTTILEVLVSLTLLTTVLTVSAPLVVRHGRLLASQRDYRLALDELSNQLEHLTALPRQELANALPELRPSDFAEARLHGAKLRGEIEAAEFGERLTLHLTWDEPQRSAAPVSLAAWIFPDPSRADASSVRSESP